MRLLVKENKIADGVWVVKKIVITVGALLPGASGRRDGSAEFIAAANLIVGHTVDKKPPVAPGSSRCGAANAECPPVLLSSSYLDLSTCALPTTAA